MSYSFRMRDVSSVVTITASASPAPAMTNVSLRLVACASNPSGIAASGVNPKFSMYIPMILPLCASSDCSIRSEAFSDRRPESPIPSTAIATVAMTNMVMTDDISIAMADSAVAMSSTIPRRTLAVSPAMNSDPDSAPTPIIDISIPSIVAFPPNSSSTYAGINDLKDIDDIVVAMTSNSRNSIVRFLAAYRSPSHTELITFSAFCFVLDSGFRIGMFPVRKNEMNIMAAMMKYVGPGPMSPYESPPIPGPARVMSAMPLAFSATALVTSRSGTSCGIIACRAGIRKDHTNPCANPAISSIHIDTTSVTMVIPTIVAMHAMTSCPYWIIFLRSHRSASAPPNRENRSIGGANPAPTIVTSR